jgi:hypothetical protein
MELDKKEQQLLAFALFTTGMRIGPDVFSTLESIAKKAGIVEPLKLVSADWINYSKTVRTADEQGKGFFSTPY